MATLPGGLTGGGGLIKDPSRGSVKDAGLPPISAAAGDLKKSSMTTVSEPDPVNDMEKRLNKLLMQTDNPNAILLHYAIVGEFAMKLAQHHALTDVVINCKNDCFHAHKAVLCCHSEFFLKIFTEEPDKSEITLNPKIQPEIFKVVLAYLYNGHLKHGSEASLIDILVVAERLKIATLSKRVREQLTIIPENCISVLNNAELVGLKDTYEKAYSYLMEHFLEVVSNDEFLDLTMEKLCCLISNEEIYVTSELDVFRSAIRWVYHNSAERTRHAERVMSCIKFILMSPEDLVKCVEEATDIMQMDACKTMLYNANWYHTCERVGKTAKFRENIMGPRKLLIEL